MYTCLMNTIGHLAEERNVRFVSGSLLRFIVKDAETGSPIIYVVNKALRKWMLR